MLALPTVFLLGVWLLLAQAEENPRNIFCYWDGESITRHNPSNVQYWMLNTKLCTHVLYGSSLGLDPSGSGELQFINPKQDPNYENLAEIRRLRNTPYKAIMSIGSWLDESKAVSKMIADMKKRDQFYTSLINILYKTKMHGVQINWKFPAHPGSQPEDRKNFATFLHELKIILQEHKFMLLVTVSARLDKATLAAYDIPKITKYADYITLMLHSDQDPYKGRLQYNAPLYGDPTRSVDSGVRHWIRQSKAPGKLLLGVPLFAQTYTLDSSSIAVGSFSSGPGRQHYGSNRAGFMTYGELCTQLSTYQRKFDKLAQVPYAVKKDQWISYEDVRSISIKMHFVKTQQLAGVQVFSLDTDDVQGDCGESYSLLRLIVSIIGDPDLLTTRPPPVEGHGLCPVDGFFRNAWDCQRYHECIDGKRIEYECIKGYYYDPKLGECLPSEKVKCNQNFVTWRPGQKPYSFENLPLNLKIVE